MRRFHRRYFYIRISLYFTYNVRGGVKNLLSIKLINRTTENKDVK